MINESFAQLGWQCPICKRVYSPFTSMCYYCGAEGITKTSTGTGTDWVKYQKEPSSFTSISTGYAQFTAENKRTCDTCKHRGGLPRNNGTTEYSGICKDCNRNMWECDKE